MDHTTGCVLCVASVCTLMTVACLVTQSLAPLALLFLLLVFFAL